MRSNTFPTSEQNVIINWSYAWSDKKWWSDSWVTWVKLPQNLVAPLMYSPLYIWTRQTCNRQELCWLQGSSGLFCRTVWNTNCLWKSCQEPPQRISPWRRHWQTRMPWFLSCHNVVGIISCPLVCTNWDQVTNLLFYAHVWQALHSSRSRRRQLPYIWGQRYQSDSGPRPNYENCSTQFSARLYV